jgi:hypothetical protein
MLARRVGPVCQERTLKTRKGVRCYTIDEGLNPRNRRAEVGFKPPYAASVKSCGSER